MPTVLRQSAVSVLVALLAVSALALLPKSPEPVALELTALPFLLFLLVGFLGLRINQSRIAALAAAFATTYAALTGITWAAAPLPGNVALARGLIAVALPAAALVLLPFSTTRLFTIRGAISVLVGASPAAALLVLAKHTTWLPEVIAWSFWTSAPSWFAPQAAFLLFALHLVGAFVRRNEQGLGFDLASSAGLIAVFYALRHTGEPHVLAVCFSAAGAMLLYSVFSMYWLRVYSDDLTSIPNRRALNEYLRSLSGRYSIAMVDVDHFKKFNDRHGHSTGDDALRFVAQHLERESRGRAFRYGGEEFCVIYRGLRGEAALERMEAARKSLCERSFFIRSRKSVRQASSKKDRGRLDRGRKKVKITVSVGVAERLGRSQRGPTVVARADKALYRAKKKGRNCVELSKK